MEAQAMTPEATGACYDFPAYYELAFDFRDLEAEVALVDRLAQAEGRSGGRHVLQLGCGPAQHLEAFARAGWRYTGLDLNPRMLAHARARADRLGVPVSLVAGSMVDFTIDDPADLVFIALGDLYAASARDLDDLLDSVAGALKPGGLFLLDWCIQFEPWRSFAPEGQSWRMERDGVAIDASVHFLPRSPIGQTFDEILELIVDDRGTRHRLASVSRKYAVYPQQFTRLIDTHLQLEFVGWWNNWGLDQPLKDSDTGLYRPITLLRRIER